MASLLFAFMCLGVGGYIVGQNIKLDEANWRMMEKRARFVLHVIKPYEFGNTHSFKNSLIKRENDSRIEN